MNLRLDIKILKLWPKLVDHYKGTIAKASNTARKKPTNVLPNTHLKKIPERDKTKADQSHGFIFCILSRAPHSTLLRGANTWAIIWIEATLPMCMHPSERSECVD